MPVVSHVEIDLCVYKRPLLETVHNREKPEYIVLFLLIVTHIKGLNHIQPFK